MVGGRGSAVDVVLDGKLVDGDAGSVRLDEVIDDIRDRFGFRAITAGCSIDLLGRYEQNEHGFVLKTPSLTR